VRGGDGADGGKVERPIDRVAAASIRALRIAHNEESARAVSKLQRAAIAADIQPGDWICTGGAAVNAADQYGAVDRQCLTGADRDCVCDGGIAGNRVTPDGCPVCTEVQAPCIGPKANLQSTRYAAERAPGSHGQRPSRSRSADARRA